MARHGTGVKTKHLFSLRPHDWSIVRFPDVLKIPDDWPHQLLLKHNVAPFAEGIICMVTWKLIFRKICKISLIAMALSISLCMCVCVCVCVCVYFFRSHRSNRSGNKKKCKNVLCRFWYLPSNGVIPKIVLRDIDLHFRFQMFKTCETRLILYVVGR